jgi:hypothetical protein
MEIRRERRLCGAGNDYQYPVGQQETQTNKLFPQANICV